MYYKGNSPDIFNIAKLIYHKNNYAKSIETKKIIITSGSNSLYGISAKSIEETFNIPTINNGVNADLQLKYHIYRTKKILNKGDIVILPLEYRVFNYSSSAIYKLELDYTFVNDKEYFISNFGLKKYFDFYNKVSINDVIKSISLSRENETKIYLDKIINNNGDILNNNGHQKIMWDNPREIKDIDYIKTDGFKLLKEFQEYCKKNSILLFITFPNTIYYKEYELPKYKSYFNNLYNSLVFNEFNVLGNPYDFMYPKELFFNTTYHLNSRGVQFRTEQFIKVLKNNTIFRNDIKETNVIQ